MKYLKCINESIFDKFNEIEDNLIHLLDEDQIGLKLIWFRCKSNGSPLRSFSLESFDPKIYLEIKEVNKKDKKAIPADIIKFINQFLGSKTDLRSDGYNAGIAINFRNPSKKKANKILRSINVKRFKIQNHFISIEKDYYNNYFILIYDKI